MKQNDKVFFSGINGLRFFAAFAVIITHIELLKSSFGYAGHWNNIVIFNLGGLGVYFFFVLSGFLITFLLLKEKEKFGTIKIKEFYLRRILRIWPLYYLILILGFFVLPRVEGIHISYLQLDFDHHFGANLLLYLLILPNLAFSLFTAVPHIGQAWSIGVEEQFYIVWPWVILKAKHILRTLILIIAGLVLVKVGVLLLGSVYASEKWYQSLKLFVAMSKFECMAIGGIGAYYLYTNNEKILRIIYHPVTLNASLALIPLLLYFTPAKLQDGIHIIFSLIFLTIILNVAMNKRVWLNLENKVFAYLGKISYGIYMYHFMIIPLVLYGYKCLHINLNEFLFNTVIYTTVLGLTIVVSGISYALFEHRFIRLKEKYALIKSGGEEKA